METTGSQASSFPVSDETKHNGFFDDCTVVVNNVTRNRRISKDLESLKSDSRQCLDLCGFFPVNFEMDVWLNRNASLFCCTRCLDIRGSFVWAHQAGDIERCLPNLSRLSLSCVPNFRWDQLFKRFRNLCQLVVHQTSRKIWSESNRTLTEEVREMARDWKRNGFRPPLVALSGVRDREGARSLTRDREDLFSTEVFRQGQDPPRQVCFTVCMADDDIARGPPITVFEHGPLSDRIRAFNQRTSGTTLSVFVHEGVFHDRPVSVNCLTDSPEDRGSSIANLLQAGQLSDVVGSLSARTVSSGILMICSSSLNVVDLSSVDDLHASWKVLSGLRCVSLEHLVVRPGHLLFPDASRGDFSGSMSFPFLEKLTVDCRNSSEESPLGQQDIDRVLVNTSAFGCVLVSVQLFLECCPNSVLDLQILERSCPKTKRLTLCLVGERDHPTTRWPKCLCLFEEISLTNVLVDSAFFQCLLSERKQNAALRQLRMSDCIVDADGFEDCLKACSEFHFLDICSTIRKRKRKSSVQ